MVAFFPVRREHRFEYSTVRPRRKTGSETVSRAPDPPLPELHAHPQVNNIEANICRQMRRHHVRRSGRECVRPNWRWGDPAGPTPARNQISESLRDQRLDNQSPIRRRVVELAAKNDVARDVAASGSMDTRLMQAIEMALGVVDPRIFHDVVFEIGQ